MADVLVEELLKIPSSEWVAPGDDPTLQGIIRELLDDGELAFQQQQPCHLQRDPWSVGSTKVGRTAGFFFLQVLTPQPMFQDQLPRSAARKPKRFVCEDCGKRYANKRSLASHRFLHDGVLPYACPRCSKQFLYHSGLKEHLLQCAGSDAAADVPGAAPIPGSAAESPASQAVCVNCGKRYFNKRLTSASSMTGCF